MSASADVEIEGVHLTRIRDKALSLGEGSRAKIEDVVVDQAGTAVASKDASVTEISASTLRGISHTAIMAHVKKPEYGPSEIIARDIVFEQVGSEALAQLGSRVRLNGVEIVPEAVDIEALYERGHMRK